MNKENVLKLADYFEATTNPYSYGQYCECVAAHTVWVFTQICPWDVTRRNDPHRWGPTIGAAKEALDLTHQQTIDLFENPDFLGRCSYPSKRHDKQHAAKVLRHFAQTGHIEWRLP